MEEIEKLKERIRFYKDELYKEQKKNQEANTWYGPNVIPNHGNEILGWSQSEGAIIVWYSHVDKQWYHNGFKVEHPDFLWKEIKYTGL